MGGSEELNKIIISKTKERKISTVYGAFNPRKQKQEDLFEFKVRMSS